MCFSDHFLVVKTLFCKAGVGKAVVLGPYSFTSQLQKSRQSDGTSNELFGKEKVTQFRII